MPTQVFRVALLGMAAVVIFDAIASLASLGLGFNYVYAAFGSMVLYGTFGYWTSRVTAITFGSLVGALLGLTDATFGWLVSWTLGPGRLEPGALTPQSWAETALQVVAVAAICGLIGGVVGRYLPGRGVVRPNTSLERTREG
jgi:hypothetical protein